MLDDRLCAKAAIKASIKRRAEQPTCAEILAFPVEGLRVFDLDSIWDDCSKTLMYVRAGRLH